MKRKSNEQSLKEVIGELVKTYKAQPKFDEIDVINAWKSEMGETIHKRTREIFLSKGVLWIRLDSSVLREELAMNKTRIIEIINEKVGKNVIKEVRLK